MNAISLTYAIKEQKLVLYAVKQNQIGPAQLTGDATAILPATKAAFMTKNAKETTFTAFQENVYNKYAQITSTVERQIIAHSLRFVDNAMTQMKFVLKGILAK
jgi:hypothetical protein